MATRSIKSSISLPSNTSMYEMSNRTSSKVNKLSIVAGACINFRSLNRINEGSLVLDLDNIDISSECTDVNVLVKQYDDSLSRILDKHAPLKQMYVVERPMNDWITDNILELKKIRRKHESIWRRTRFTIHFDLYKESCKAVKQSIIECKAKIMQQKIIDCNGD